MEVVLYTSIICMILRYDTTHYGQPYNSRTFVDPDSYPAVRAPRIPSATILGSKVLQSIQAGPKGWFEDDVKSLGIESRVMQNIEFLILSRRTLS
jgi:hypothetical protein